MTIDELLRLADKAGSYFFRNGSFHKSRPILCTRRADGTIFFIERYRTAYLGPVRVQTPHDRVFAWDGKSTSMTCVATDLSSRKSRAVFNAAVSNYRLQDEDATR